MRRWRRRRPIPGDCGDEYRRPPFLTASGDLSHHLAAIPTYFKAQPVPRAGPGGSQVDSGSVWEPIAGYSRAVRVGDRVLVSGTTATHGSGETVCPGDPAGQTTYHPRQDRRQPRRRSAPRWRTWSAPASICRMPTTGSRCRAPTAGRSATIRPANTLLEVGRLVGDYLVEIEAEAVLDYCGSGARLIPPPAQAACSARATIWVGLTKRSAMTSQINVVTV